MSETRIMAKLQLPDSGMPTALTVDVIAKGFGNGLRPNVVEAVQFEVARGETVAVLGPSGSGKTTLLRMIAGLDTDFVGEIKCLGHAVTGPHPSRSLVFQDARLLPWRTVRANVAFGLPREIPGGDRGKVDEALRLVGLEEAQSAWPRQLSGGMEKRAALARAIVASPDLLLLDEPFGALDFSTRIGLQGELQLLCKRLGLTCLIVTHDVDEAVFLADRAVILGGRPTRVVQQIPIPLDHPRNRTHPAFDKIRLKLLASILGT